MISSPSATLSAAENESAMPFRTRLRIACSAAQATAVTACITCLSATCGFAMQLPDTDGRMEVGGYLDGRAVVPTDSSPRQRPGALADVWLDTRITDWLRARVDLRGAIGGPFEGANLGTFNFADAFQELELRDLGFDGVDPAATGRPAYHPSPMLKLYIYGYLNRVQSSRRLEREAGRNLKVMWLTGRLAPDHKTIADFRKDNGSAIKKGFAQFVELCRKMGLLAKASVAIDGSKFKAVNSRDNNFTQGKIQRRQKQIEESMARYMSQLDTADRQTAAGEEPSETVLLTKTRLKEKLAKLEEEVKRLAAIEKALLASPDKQISLTDPDCRSMATSGRGSGMVAYNVQSAVDTTNHLIVAHEVTNVGTDRSQLATMAQAAKAALRSDNLEVVADRGYFKGEELLGCEQAGVAVTLPKPQTSGAKSAGRLGNLILFTWPRTMPIAARPARSWRTTSPRMKMARKCGFT